MNFEQHKVRSDCSRMMRISRTQSELSKCRYRLFLILLAFCSPICSLYTMSNRINIFFKLIDAQLKSTSGLVFICQWKGITEFISSTSDPLNKETEEFFEMPEKYNPDIKLSPNLPYEEEWDVKSCFFASKCVKIPVKVVRAATTFSTVQHAFPCVHSRKQLKFSTVRGGKWNSLPQAPRSTKLIFSNSHCCRPEKSQNLYWNSKILTQPYLEIVPVISLLVNRKCYLNTISIPC